MGAADVIPFMPVRGVTMDACVELARDFGGSSPRRSTCPVYLYDRAALIARARVARRRPQGASSKGCATRSRRANGSRTSVRTRSGGRAPPRWALGSRSSRSTSTWTGTDEAGGQGDRARRCGSRRAACPRCARSGSRVPERGGVVTVSMNLVDHEVTGLRAAFDAVARRAQPTTAWPSRIREIVGLVPGVGARPGRRRAPAAARVRPGPPGAGAARGRRGGGSEA